MSHDQGFLGHSQYFYGNLLKQKIQPGEAEAADGIKRATSESARLG